MTNLKNMIKTLPSTEYDWNGEDVTNHIKPIVRTYNYDGEDVIDISDEMGNMNCFVYSNERIVDIKDELKVWAKKYNKQWECRYEGTYVLLDQ